MAQRAAVLCIPACAGFGSRRAQACWGTSNRPLDSFFHRARTAAVTLPLVPPTHLRAAAPPGSAYTQLIPLTLPHPSPITYHPSPITHHPSPITPPLQVYMKGSMNMSYDSSNLTTPDIKWLGVRPSDLDRFDIPQQCRLPMTEEDIKTGRKLVGGGGWGVPWCPPL